MSAVNMEVESKLVNPVDTALQLMTVELSEQQPPWRERPFFVRGSRLLTSSNKVLTENSVSFLGQTNYGYEGCAS